MSILFMLKFRKRLLFIVPGNHIYLNKFSSNKISVMVVAKASRTAYLLQSKLVFKFIKGYYESFTRDGFLGMSRVVDGLPR